MPALVVCAVLLAGVPAWAQTDVPATSLLPSSIGGPTDWTRAVLDDGKNVPPR